MNSQDPSTLKTLGVVSGLGFQLVGWVLAGAFAGYHADIYLQTSPVMVLLGILLGITGAGYTLWRVLKLLERRKQSS